MATARRVLVVLFIWATSALAGPVWGVAAAQTTPRPSHPSTPDAALQSPRAPSTESVEVASVRAQAEQGDAVAQYNLGLMYEQGRVVPRDDAQAVAWYRRAAEQGAVDAQLQVGIAYASGRGVPRDDALAVAWYRKAAEQGSAAAQNNLGIMYAEGRGVPRDAAQAAEWFRKAADQGLAVAQNSLGNRYARGEGVPPDAAQAAFWYRRAAERGHGWARFNLGKAYATGRGVTPDVVESQMWYSLAPSGDARWHSRTDQQEFIKARDEQARQMTPKQLADSQLRALEWQMTFDAMQDTATATRQPGHLLAPAWAAQAKPCVDFPEFGAPQYPALHRFTGEDATIYLDAVEPDVRVPEWDLVLVMSLHDTPYWRTLGAFEWAFAVPYVAVAGRDGCLAGAKFLGPIAHRAAVAMVNRHRAGKLVTSAALQEAAAAGDAEATTLLAIRWSIEHPYLEKGPSWNLVLQAAKQNVGLALMALAYWTSGFGYVNMPGTVDPVLDRAAAFCWLSVGSQSSDPDVRSFSESLLQVVAKDLSQAERATGAERWDRTRRSLDHPSCE